MVSIKAHLIYLERQILQVEQEHKRQLTFCFLQQDLFACLFMSLLVPHQGLPCLGPPLQQGAKHRDEHQAPHGHQELCHRRLTEIQQWMEAQL